MSLFGHLATQTRSFASRKFLHPKKFTSNNVPTKPRSAWQIYLRENIRKVKTEDGKIDAAKATTELGKTWKTVSEQEKKIYQQRFEQESKAHYESLEKALNNATPLQFFNENLLRKKYNLSLLKDPKQPKRPMNSFLYYLEHLKVIKDPIFNIRDARTRISEGAKKYKVLSPTEKKVYEEKAAIAREQFNIDNKKYWDFLDKC